MNHDQRRMVRPDMLRDAGDRYTLDRAHIDTYAESTYGSVCKEMVGNEGPCSTEA